MSFKEREDKKRKAEEHQIEEKHVQRFGQNNEGSSGKQSRDNTGKVRLTEILESIWNRSRYNNSKTVCIFKGISNDESKRGN